MDLLQIYPLFSRINLLEVLIPLHCNRNCISPFASITLILYPTYYLQLCRLRFALNIIYNRRVTTPRFNLLQLLWGRISISTVSLAIRGNTISSLKVSTLIYSRYLELLYRYADSPNEVSYI